MKRSRKRATSATDPIEESVQDAPAESESRAEADSTTEIAEKPTDATVEVVVEAATEGPAVEPAVAATIPADLPVAEPQVAEPQVAEPQVAEPEVAPGPYARLRKLPWPPNLSRFRPFNRSRRERSNPAEQPPEHPDAKYYRATLWAFVGLFALLAAAAAGAFLVALRPAEQTQVPNVTGQELVQTVIDLQERGLIPFVQLRYFSDPLMKGRVIGQDPSAGTTVRVGRRVNLVVSQGAIVEEVGSYIDRPLADVQTELLALFSTSDQLLSIGNISYVFHSKPAGTVIEQRPAPGTDIVGPTALNLVVSRGPEIARTALPTYLGLSWEDAVAILSRDNIPFVFKLEAQPTIGPDGVVVGQSPEPQTEVAVGSGIELTIRDVRSVPRGHRFGIFDRTLPEYAVRVGVTAVAIGPDGDPRTLFSMQHPGGRISFPYRLPEGSAIVLYRLDTEVVRVMVRDSESE